MVARLSRVRGDGQHEISVRLDPPELGGVQVDARLEGTRLTVRIHAEQAAARELLAEALPRLRASLAEQGFVPGEVSVQLGLDSSPRGRGGDDRPVPPTFASGGPAPSPKLVPAVPYRVRAGEGLDLWA
ncbi:MAG TPA: flagellar hook-length control protein FliK [Terriglobales bacterium]|nr:flagellar hook-length control protein FliK [Terriglobales bacterium]